MDFHGIDAQGNLYLPRDVTIPTTGSTQGRIFYLKTNDMVYKDIGNDSVSGNGLAQGYPVGPLTLADHSSLSHPGTPIGAEYGMIPLSDERHWHWANVVAYDKSLVTTLGVDLSDPSQLATVAYPSPKTTASKDNLQESIDEFKTVYNSHVHPHLHDDRYALITHTHLNSQFFRVTAMGTIQTMTGLLKIIAGINGTINTIIAKTTSGTCNVNTLIDGSQFASFAVSSTGVTITVSQAFTKYSTLSVNVDTPNGTDLMLAIKYQET